MVRRFLFVVAYPNECVPVDYSSDTGKEASGSTFVMFDLRKKQIATQFDSAETSDVKFDPVGPAPATVVVSAAGSRQHGSGASHQHGWGAI